MIDKPFSNYLNIFLWSINWLNGLIVAAVTVTVELSDRLNVTHWAHTGLQHRLELSGHADLLLFLADDSLDGGGEAAGVAWEDQGVAVVAASILLQGAAGVRDGVVVVVRVDDPVVVTWKSRQQEVSLSCVCVRPRVCVCVCVRKLTSAGQVAGQALVVHEHLAGVAGVGHRVLSSHVGAHNPEPGGQTFSYLNVSHSGRRDSYKWRTPTQREWLGPWRRPPWHRRLQPCIQQRCCPAGTNPQDPSSAERTTFLRTVGENTNHFILQ